mmetsp:Transcript_38298/g.88342  ORF Transcript_38298/g.88342 Transcript_38298/m.88342 type:complete len:212 (+) Transcript_38298:94-729(+)
MFGVWLDADVAGRQVSKREVEAAQDPTSEISEDDKAEIFFAEGTRLMKRGDFASAAALYERAVDLVSADTRRGGEYSLWLAQAMHAAGDEGEAVSLLRALEKSHRDRAVSVVAAEILYIFTAPKLELGKDSFIGIPDMTQIDSWDAKKSYKLASTLPKGQDYAKMEKGPDKYSLEWVKDQRIVYPEPTSRTEIVLVGLAIAGATASVFIFA